MPETLSMLLLGVERPERVLETASPTIQSKEDCMPDDSPLSEAIRISNALDNLGSASLILEGLVLDREKAILNLLYILDDLFLEQALSSPDELEEHLDHFFTADLKGRTRRTIAEVIRRHAPLVSLAKEMGNA